jgi:hypothetical protein
MKIIVLFLLFIAGVASAQIPRIISYQGMLNDKNGKPVPDGDYQLKLTLYPTRTGAVEVYTKNTAVTTSGGLFSVLLDSIPETVLFDKQYYLGISINGGTELKPRTPLAAAPYSLNSSGIKSITSTDTSIIVTNGTGPDVSLKIGTIPYSKISNKPSGLPPSGTAGGDLTGTYPDPLLKNTGVNAGTYSNPTVTVNAKGLVTNIINGSPGSGLTLPYAGSASANVVFQITNTTNNVNGTAIKGIIATGTGSWTNPTGGAGVYGENTQVTDANPVYGVLGRVNSSFINSAGVFGYNNAVTGGNGVQGYGFYGVYGAASTPAGGAGVIGVGNNNAQAGLFIGNVTIQGALQVTGAKNAVVEIAPNDYRAVYAEEAAESYFTDYGTAQLIDGKAVIELDAVFLAAVTIDEKHPMHVFIQPLGESNGVYVVKSDRSFTVLENGSGKSNIAFDWRIAAKRKHFENVRLEPTSLTNIKK